MNVRPFVEDDAPAVAALISAEEERFYGRPGRLTAADVLKFRQWHKEAWVWEEDGRIAASATYGVHGEAANTRGVVGDKGHGLGTEILERGEAFARAEGMTKILTGAPEPDAAARALFESRGYREVRRFYEMAIELEEAPEVPNLGIETLDLEDVEEFHTALDEAFQDHWEHHGLPFEEWWERHRGNPNLDLSLWFVIRERGQMAAVSRNEANRNGGGYVAAIGVRRPWRGKGYAKALLLHTFREFFDRGIKRVTLGVDAENPTGATHLYERVGMHVEQENVVFEKSFA